MIELSEDGETLVMTYVNGALAQVFERVKESPVAHGGAEVDLGTFRSEELDTELKVVLAAGRLRLAWPRLGTLSLESIGPASFACANLTADLEPDLVRPRLIVVATYGTRRLVFRPVWRRVLAATFPVST